MLGSDEIFGKKKYFNWTLGGHLDLKVRNSLNGTGATRWSIEWCWRSIEFILTGAQYCLLTESQYLLNFWFLLVFVQLVVQWHFMAQKLIILAEIKISDKFSWEFNLLKQGIMSNEWRVNYRELIHWNCCSRGLNELNLIGFVWRAAPCDRRVKWVFFFT